MDVILYRVVFGLYDVALLAACYHSMRTQLSTFILLILYLKVIVIPTLFLYTYYRYRYVLLYVPYGFGFVHTYH